MAIFLYMTPEESRAEDKKKLCQRLSFTAQMLQTNESLMQDWLDTLRALSCIHLQDGSFQLRRGHLI